MRTLLLMRHAKSSHDDSSLSDHQRPLTARGERDAQKMGVLLKQAGYSPALALCSTAVRARRTAELVLHASGPPIPVRHLDSLYLAEPDTYLVELAGVADDPGCVLCVGHNPGIEVLVARLAGQHRRMPTAALAVIDAKIYDWASLRSGESASLRSFWCPRDLD